MMRDEDRQALKEFEGLETVEEARRATEGGWDWQVVVITLGLLRTLLKDHDAP